MAFLSALKILIALSTMAFGLVSIVSPSAAERFTGLKAENERGTSEIRAVLGGLFVGLGIAALIYRTPAAYGTLGLGYLGTALVRAGSMYFDRAATKTNWISLGFEIGFAVLLLI